jgi:endogenous inhibitor of DNA gyrase (YacG/DUF329 family)
MAKKKVASLRCPTCRKIVLKDDPEFPFCSARCRTIDLGKWASGDYKISVPILDPGEFEDAQQRESNRRKIEDTDFEVDEYQRRNPN